MDDVVARALAFEPAARTKMWRAIRREVERAAQGLKKG
jgi:hypothetical protein